MEQTTPKGPQTRRVRFSVRRLRLIRLPKSGNEEATLSEKFHSDSGFQHKKKGATPPPPVVLTDHGSGDEFGRTRKAILLRSSIWKRPIFEKSPLRIVRAIVWGVKLWLVSLTSRQAGPIITYGHEHGFLFAFLQWFFSPVIPRRTHLLFDFLLSDPRSGMAGVLGRAKAAIFNAAIDGAVVWGKPDVDRFARAHRLDQSKLIFHHYHTTMRGFDFQIQDGGYIFAGGNAARDYQTLIAALAPIDHPVIIATTNPTVAAMAAPYRQISVRGVSPAEFRVLLASCHIFVEAHDPAFFRTSGHQTFLNAMYCGKPVVLADPASADGYIENEVDGLVVPIDDHQALQSAISRMLIDAPLRKRLASAAQAKAGAANFSIPHTMQSIYNHALSLDWKRAKNAPSPVVLRLF